MLLKCYCNNICDSITVVIVFISLHFETDFLSVDSIFFCRYAAKISIHQYDIFAAFRFLGMTLRLCCRYVQTGFEYIVVNSLQSFIIKLISKLDFV